MDNKKGSKWIWIVSIIAILVIIIAVVVAFMFLRTKEEDETEENNGLTKWGNEYYMFLDDLAVKEKKEIKDIINLKEGERLLRAQFIKLRDVADPIMVVSYGNDENEYNQVFYIENDEVLNVDQSREEKIELDYNVEEEEYDYYLVEETSEGKSYTKIADKIKDGNDAKTYEFKNEDKKESKDIDGNVIDVVKKEDEKFISNVVGEDDFVLKVIDLDDEDLKDKLLEGVKDAENSVIDIEEIITDTIKEDTEKKVEEVNEKIKKIDETNKETEIALEEKAKKEAEEAAKTIKAGNHNLKAGKYVGKDFSGGTDGAAMPAGTLTYDIKADGTYSWSSTSGGSGSGTYKVVSMDSLGMGNNSYYAGLYAIQLSGGQVYCVRSNNSFEELAGSGQTFKLSE